MKKLVIVLLLHSSFNLFSQTFLNVPGDFNRQNKKSFIDKINKGEAIDITSSSKKFWYVYSDRSRSQLYNSAGGGAIRGDFLDFMDELYVEEVKINSSKNWFKVYNSIDGEYKGWVAADKLILSKYSLKTEGLVSIPRKAIILTSLDDILLDDESIGTEALDEVLRTKHFFSQPNTKAELKIASPNTFDILFVLKEQNGSVLLANTDYLNENAILNKSKVYGWIPIANRTEWDQRIAYEPNMSDEAINEYSGEELFGFKTLDQMKECIEETRCFEKLATIKKEVKLIKCTEMRSPLLSNVPNDNNYKQVISIAKNSNEIDPKSEEEIDLLVKELEVKLQQTNIVFAIDATHSMENYFKSVSESINKIIDNQSSLGQNNLKFGIILYRDYNLSENKVYEVTDLTNNQNLIKEKLNQKNICLRTEGYPEAQYFGLREGLSEISWDDDASNVLVLIGDCGNHKPDPKGATLNDVVDILQQKRINLITFQVDSDQFEDAYIDFNDDAIEYIHETAKKIIDKGSLAKPRMTDIGNNTYKLEWNQVPGDYTNMFGKFIYADGEPMKTSYLEKQIIESINEYTLSVLNNINSLRMIGNTPDIDGNSGELEGMIALIIDKKGVTRQEALDFLNRTELTTSAFIAVDYHGNGINAFDPVVYLSQREYDKLNKSLRKLVSNSASHGGTDAKIALKENLILVVKSILGQGVSTSSIEDLTMNEIWEIVLGIPLNNETVKYTMLKDIGSADGFTDFYEDFVSKSNTFLNRNYFNSSNVYKSRRFTLYGSYFYWIPLSDLPGGQ